MRSESQRAHGVRPDCNPNTPLPAPGGAAGGVSWAEAAAVAGNNGMRDSLVLCGDRRAPAAVLKALLEAYLGAWNCPFSGLTWDPTPDMAARDRLPDLWARTMALTPPSLIETTEPLAAPLTEDALVAEVVRDFRLPVLALSRWDAEGIERLVALAAIARHYSLSLSGVLLALGTDAPPLDELVWTRLRERTGLPLIGIVPAEPTDPVATVANWDLERLPAWLARAALGAHR